MEKFKITTSKKEITIIANFEKLIGLAVGYNKEHKCVAVVLPFIVLKIRTKLLIEQNNKLTEEAIEIFAMCEDAKK